MSCCSFSGDIPAKHLDCPQSYSKSLQVPFSTVLLHLKQPWRLNHESLEGNQYYFCTDSNCEVVYFTADNLVIKKSELRTVVGIKELNNDDAPACYCFDITLSDVKNNSDLKQFVVDKTRNNICACKKMNPSGRCCLKDFPKSE